MRGVKNEGLVVLMKDQLPGTSQSDAFISPRVIRPTLQPCTKQQPHSSQPPIPHSSKLAERLAKPQSRVSKRIIIPVQYAEARKQGRMSSHADLPRPHLQSAWRASCCSSLSWCESKIREEAPTRALPYRSIEECFGDRRG